MKIELLYFEGCPSWRKAEENLKTVLDELGITDPVGHVRVETPEEAERLSFPGSPTIRIDGADIEAGAGEGKRFSLACRIYREGQEAYGWPSVRMIREAFGRMARDEGGRR